MSHAILSATLCIDSCLTHYSVNDRCLLILQVMNAQLIVS